MNHRLIGSKYIHNINDRNKQVMRGNIKNLFNKNSLSIINPRLHPVLDIGCSDMGSHISHIGGEKIIPNSCYKFEKTLIADKEIMSRLRSESNRLYKKIGN